MRGDRVWSGVGNEGWVHAAPNPPSPLPDPWVILGLHTGLSVGIVGWIVGWVPSGFYLEFKSYTAGVC